jgi:hypothetical protein
VRGRSRTTYSLLVAGRAREIVATPTTDVAPTALAHARSPKGMRACVCVCSHAARRVIPLLLLYAAVVDYRAQSLPPV